MPEELPAVLTPPSRKTVGSPPSVSRVVSARMCSSLRNSVSRPRRPTMIGVTSSSKTPSSQACRARCCEPRGDLVDLVAVELVALREVVGRLAHREAAVAVAEALPERVLKLRLRGEAQAPARAPHDMRGLAHRLGPAGEHQLGAAEHDLLCALRDRLEAGAAEAVHGQRGRLDRQPRLEADVAGEVDRVGGGLLDVAEDDVGRSPRRTRRRRRSRRARWWRRAAWR